MNPTHIDPSKYDVGVIVARFQVPDLHEGQRALIDFVAERHRKLVIVLGVAPVANSISNPLDFEARRQMIHEVYPKAVVLYVKDHSSDETWSRNLDSVIRDVISPTQTALLYGSRDSFINYYTGRFNTYEMLQEGYKSGTEIRNEVRQEAVPSPDFRSGVIWASANRYPVVYSAVDVAVLNLDRSEILLGRKDGARDFRLLGGFADPGSDSFEADAYREVGEEAHVALLYELEYLGSFNIDDWRYRKEPDIIRTHLYVGIAETLAQAKADDDIVEVRAFKLDVLRHTYKTTVVPEHHALIEKVLAHVA